VLFITILVFTESLPLKATVFILLFEMFSPNLKVTVNILCIEICSAASESAIITWPSPNQSVLMSLFLEILIPFYLLFFPFCKNLIYMLNKFGESWQPCRNPVLFFYRFVSVCHLIRFHFVVFIYVYNCCKQSLRIFLSCKMLHSSCLLTPSKKGKFVSKLHSLLFL